MDSNTKTNKISASLLALLKYSKFVIDADVTWTGLRNHVLGEIFHEDMTLGSVLNVVLNAYEEAAADPRFELAYRHMPIRNLLVEPLSKFTNPWTRDLMPERMTLEQFYNVIFERIMIEFRLARVDWCKDQLSNA